MSVEDYPRFSKSAEELRQELKGKEAEQEELARRSAELEKQKAELRQKLGQEAIATFKLAKELHEMSDDEYAFLENNSWFDSGSSAELEAMQDALSKVQNYKKELDSMSDEEFKALVDKANAGDQDAQWKLDRLQKASVTLGGSERVVQNTSSKPETTTTESQPAAGAEAEPAADSEAQPTAGGSEAEPEENAEAEPEENTEAEPENAENGEDANEGDDSGILTPEELKNVKEGRNYDDNGEDDDAPIADFEEDTGGEDDDDAEIDDLDKGPKLIWKSKNIGDIARRINKKNTVDTSDAEIANVFEAIQGGAEEVEGVSVDEITEALDKRIDELENEDETGETGEEKGATEEKKRRIRDILKTKLGKPLVKAALIATTAVALLTGIGIHLMGNKNVENPEANAAGANEKIEYNLDEKGDGKGERAEKERGGEQVSSVARFEIDGKEYKYENMKHQGGYDLEKDAYFDEGKDGNNSMSAPAYEGEWSNKKLYEAYGNSLENLKKSVGISAQMAGALGVVEGIDSLHELNDLASTYERGDEDSYNEFATDVSDYINEYADGGEVVSWNIDAGESYMSTYETQDGDLDGDVNTYLDMDVSHNYSTPVIDVKNSKGESLFNNEETQNKVKELYGISSGTKIMVGWSTRCGQLVVKKIKRVATSKVVPVPSKVTIKTPMGEMPPTLTITPPSETSTPTPTPETPTPTPETPTPTPETPTPTPETPTPTPETPTPTPETPTPTPETPTPTPETPTPTPETPTPTPEETLAPKGPDTHAGDHHEQMGPTENNNDDKEVTAEERGNVNPEEKPGSAVEGSNEEGVNKKDVNPGDLKQTEPEEVEDKSNPDSKTENVQHGGSEDELAERMRQAEEKEAEQKEAEEGRE